MRRTVPERESIKAVGAEAGKRCNAEYTVSEESGSDKKEGINGCWMYVCWEQGG